MSKIMQECPLLPSPSRGYDISDSFSNSSGSPAPCSSSFRNMNVTSILYDMLNYQRNEDKVKPDDEPEQYRRKNSWGTTVRFDDESISRRSSVPCKPVFNSPVQEQNKKPERKRHHHEMPRLTRIEPSTEVECSGMQEDALPEIRVTVNNQILRDGDSSDESLASTDDTSASSRCSADIIQSSSHRNSEEEVEQTRYKFMTLSTKYPDGMPKFLPAKSQYSAAAVNYLSHPFIQDLRRGKRPGGDPMDLSVKRKRSEPAMGEFDGGSKLLEALKRGRSSTFSFGGKVPIEGGSKLLEALKRGRSSTFSFGGKVPDPVVAGVSGLTGHSSGSQDSLTSGNNFKTRARVTLAKRNLNPVKSRVLERIHAMVSFVADLPEFNSLPMNDQLALLSSASHRLLLLFMAENCMEFAVTPAQTDDKDEESRSEASSDGSSECRGDEGKPKKRVEFPTMQFVEGLQNFISKCHKMEIRPAEYFYMRWIVLFHAGANKLERGDVISNLNSAARQDLQEIIEDSHPNDKLRYSKLLLTLHTVFGVNCSMLESLFCTPLQLAGGLESFASRLLLAYQEGSNHGGNKWWQTKATES